MAGDIPHIRSCILRRNLINEYPMVQIEYLELRRSGYEVYVGQYGTDGEVDFVAIKNGRVEYYRVAQTTLDDKVLERELAPMKKIRDNFPKYLLTLDDLFGEMNYEGIEKRNVLKIAAGVNNDKRGEASSGSRKMLEEAKNCCICRGSIRGLR